MIALEVHVNGKRLCTAGVGRRGVLSAIASWVNRGARNRKTGKPLHGKFVEELSFDVGGLAHGADGEAVHLNWVGRRCRVGDEIRIKNLKTSKVDKPRSRRREDPGLVDKQKRRYYEQLKREYGD